MCGHYVVINTDKPYSVVVEIYVGSGLIEVVPGVLKIVNPYLLKRFVKRLLQVCQMIPTNIDLLTLVLANVVTQKYGYVPRLTRTAGPFQANTF